MVVKAVIFDLDGTLASFNMDYRTVRAEVRSFLMRHGFPASILTVNESIFEMLKKVEIFMKNNGRSKEEFMNVRSKALAVADKYEFEAAKTTSLLPGVLETLKALKEMDLKMGLCTVNSQKSTDYILKRFGIAEFFDAVTPRDKVKYVKPNSEHMEATLKSLGVKPEETVVAGDSHIDMKCAKELKAIAVGLPTGVSTSKQLIDSGANYLVTALIDLPNLIEYINKKTE